MIIRIDARRLTDPAGLHGALAAAFGFPPSYGKNLDALVDCLTDLDDPGAGRSGVQLFPGQVALLAVDHADAAPAAAGQLAGLADAVAFVNWRRLEEGRPPVLALAYDRRP